MSFDYSVLKQSEDGIGNTWREIYYEDFSLPVNLLRILRNSVFLPHDFYDLIAAYFLLPSALCNVVPYLFLHGQSGSGKTTLAKVAKHLHGVSFNSSSDTFAGIRNSLDKRRIGYVEIPFTDDESSRTCSKQIERNTCMVWDDVDASVFINSPDLYRLFKFGYDRSTDKITLSSKETGVNLEFRCFCPKVFSTISPLHLDDRFRELRRRLIVIPCSAIEELPEARCVELGIADDWQSKLLNIDAYDWKGFSDVFQSYWDLEMASKFLTARRSLNTSKIDLPSKQLAVSLDLLATGIATGIWANQGQAIAQVRSYWKWFKSETEASTGLGQMLKSYFNAEVKNAEASNRTAEIPYTQLRHQIRTWVEMGWLMDAPRSKEVSELAYDLGWRFKQGKWIKG